MRKTPSAVKIQTNCKTIFHQCPKTQEPSNQRMSYEPQDRRKQSLPMANKTTDQGLMSQIKQALRSRQSQPDNIQYRLSEIKRLTCDDLEQGPYRHQRKQNRPSNTQDREATFKDNLKQMQQEISSLKKLMDYQKARNHKLFEEKLFTVEQKCEQHKQMDEKIQAFNQMVQVSTNFMANQRSIYLQQLKRGAFVGRQQFLQLQEQVQAIKSSYTTIQGVDKRLADTLEIFKTFLIQNIEKSIMDTVTDKTRNLDQVFNQMSEQIASLSTQSKASQREAREMAERSNHQLLEQIDRLRQECRAESEIVAREQIGKYRQIAGEFASDVSSRMDSEISKMKEEWTSRLIHYRDQKFEFQGSLEDMYTRINIIETEGAEVAEIAQQTMDVVRTLITRTEKKTNALLDPQPNLIASKNIESKARPRPACHQTTINHPTVQDKPAGVLDPRWDSFPKVTLNSGSSRTPHQLIGCPQQDHSTQYSQWGG